MKSLCIIDDHSMLRNGIASFLKTNSDWEIAGQAASEKEALDMLSNLNDKKTLPDVLICDINLSKENSGLDVMRYVKNNYPQIKIIAYSMFESISYINRAVEAGASGYVPKSADENELLKGIEEVYKGNKFFQNGNINTLIVYSNVLQSLTKREKAVFDLLLLKKSNSEIAETLAISRRTVDNYISCIYDKIDCYDRNELIQMFGEE